jgi:hypothetical protein
MHHEQPQAVELTLSTRRDAAADPRSLPVLMGFVNSGDEPVRLLAHFEPLPVFFSFRLVKADGTPVAVPGAGKIDFGPGKPECLELAPGDTHTVDADVGTLLTGELEPGRYSLSATYHNQYGEACFRGVLESNEISIDVPAS